MGLEQPVAQGGNKDRQRRSRVLDFAHGASRRGDRPTSAVRCSSPTGASPVSISAGAPSSRPQASAERPMVQAGCHKPLRRKPAPRLQHRVKRAAPTWLQGESRATHATAKATSAAPQSRGARTAGPGGYRAQRACTERNETRGSRLCGPGQGRAARISRRGNRARHSRRPRGP
jgi:hypothetical protein